MVLFRDALPAKNIVIENKIRGDYSRLSLEWGSSKILINCCYALNDDSPVLDSEMRVNPVNSLGKCLMTAMMLDMMLL